MALSVAQYNFILKPALENLEIAGQRRGEFNSFGLLRQKTLYKSDNIKKIVSFIPRREIRSILLGVQLILFPFIGVSKSLEPFKNINGFSMFFPRNVVFDGSDGWTVTKSVL